MLRCDRSVSPTGEKEESVFVYPLRLLYALHCVLNNFDFDLIFIAIIVSLQLGSVLDSNSKTIISFALRQTRVV